MLIYVKIKKKKCFLSDGRTDTWTTQNYSSEPHKKKSFHQLSRKVKSKKF